MELPSLALPSSSEVALDARPLRNALARRLRAADAIELQAVRRCVAFSERWRLQPAARLFTRLGNGWLYPMAAALLLLLHFEAAARCVAAAAMSLAAALTIYPPLKRAIARTRPCDRDARLAVAFEPLDRYACPSGHAMTAAAFGVPLIFAAPLVAAPIVIAGCVLVGWSRVALGHHYISDLVAGTLLGGAIASAVAAFVV